MKLKYDFICTDLDDTLINSRQELTEKTKKAVEHFINAGGKFTIVTGRMTHGAIPVCRELGLFGEVITFQGAVVCDIASGNVLSEVVIDTADAVTVGKYLEKERIYYQTYIGDYFITEKATNFSSLYGKLSRSEYKETTIPLSEYLEKKAVCPPKLLIMDEPTKIPEILKKLKANFGEKFLINTSKPFIIEIVPKEICKGYAVRKLAEKYNRTSENTICIGDSDNDITMLDYSSCGVAVANASPSVKKHAKVIAPSCDDDGVAWVIENLAFIK